MNLTDVYLKFDSQEEFEAIDTTMMANIHIDVVGILLKETGEIETTVDGYEIPKCVPIEGYHVNIRLVDREIPEEFEPYVIPTPAYPKRVFC